MVPKMIQSLKKSRPFPFIHQLDQPGTKSGQTNNKTLTKSHRPRAGVTDLVRVYLNAFYFPEN